MQVGGSREDAEEAAQDALFGTLRRLEKLDFRPSESGPADPLLGYLIRATKTNVRLRHRTHVRELRAFGELTGRSGEGVMPLSDVVGDPAAENVWDSTARSDDLVQLDRIIASLKQEDRELVRMRASTTLTWKEIAEEMGISHDNARQRWGRIKNRLEDAMKDAKNG